jgi:hypothetical protein
MEKLENVSGEHLGDWGADGNTMLKQRVDRQAVKL